MSEVQPSSILALLSLFAPLQAGQGTLTFSLPRVWSQSGVHQEPGVTHALLAPGISTSALKLLF